MRNLFLILIVLGILFYLGCSSSLPQFYPDSFFSEDNVYQNKPLRFSLTFVGNWIIETDPNNMDPSSKGLAQEMQKRGAELLFIGITSEATQGVRAIAAHLNYPVREYAEEIRKVNKPNIEADSGIIDMVIKNHELVKWEYVSSGFRHIEFFFHLDTYNIRIAFFSKPHIFENFLPIYYRIISSLAFIEQF